MERADYLYGGLRPVTCAACGACVEVKKHSVMHTSVQWTPRERARCLELDGDVSALVPTCHRLRNTIDEAVARGELEVPDA